MSVLLPSEYLLFTDAVARSCRKWLKNIFLIVLEFRVAQPALWDEVLNLGPVVWIVVHWPLPNINISLILRSDICFSQIHNGIRNRHTLSGINSPAIIPPPLAVIRGRPPGTGGKTRIDSSSTANMYDRCCTLVMVTSSALLKFDRTSCASLAWTSG